MLVVIVVVVEIVVAGLVTVVVVSVTCIKGHRFPTGQRLFTAHCSQDGSWQLIDHCKGTNVRSESTAWCNTSDRYYTNQ